MELREFLEQKQFIRVPLSKLATGHYKVKMKVNKVTGNFIVDTGASNSCIGTSFAATFHVINELSDVKAAGAGATGMETHISHNNSFLLQGKTTNNQPLIVFDLSHVNTALNQADEESVHGIIGADVLKKWRTVIDYGRNCMFIK